MITPDTLIVDRDKAFTLSVIGLNRKARRRIEEIDSIIKSQASIGSFSTSKLKVSEDIRKEVKFHFKEKGFDIEMSPLYYTYTHKGQLISSVKENYYMVLSWDNT